MTLAGEYLSLTFTIMGGVYVLQGYRQKDAFIVTQMPLPTTVMDFWTMIYDHEVKAIIMMNQFIPKDEVSIMTILKV